MGKSNNTIMCPYCNEAILVKRGQFIQCEHCGARITTSGKPYKEASKAFSIVSIVNGIIALLTSWFFLGIINAIVGIAFGIVGIAKKKLKGLAIAGLITSIIALLVGVLSGYIYYTALTFQPNQSTTQMEESADILDYSNTAQTNTEDITDTDEIVQTKNEISPDTDSNSEYSEDQVYHNTEEQEYSNTDENSISNNDTQGSDDKEESIYYVLLYFNYEEGPLLSYKDDVKIYIDGEYIDDLDYNSQKTIEAYLSSGKHTIYVKRKHRSGKSNKISFNVSEYTYKEIRVYEDSIKGMNCEFSNE